jgi:RHS repeat-associated protein
MTETSATFLDVSPNLVSTTTFGYDKYNNETDRSEYDFGLSGAGALVRRTHTDYLRTNPVNNTNYAADPDIHIRSLPVQTSTFDAQDVERARTSYEYDNYAAGLTPRANISGHANAYGTSYLTRGNPTKISRWLLPSTMLPTLMAYDIAGNVVGTTDPLGHTATFGFSDRFGSPDAEATLNTVPSELAQQGETSYAFVTSVTNALNQTTYTQYDYYLGRPVDAQDFNGVVSSASYNDLLDRPTQVVRAASAPATERAQTSFIYADSAHIVTTTSDLNAYNDNVLSSSVLYDGLGRTTETRQSTPDGTVFTTRQYDALGRVRRSTNPYRSTAESTYGYIVTSYDALSRVTRLETFDGNDSSTGAVVTSFSSNATTVTDQSNKSRRSITDGLGRLTRVDEPNSSGNLGTVALPNQPTSYAYDVMDDLTSVSQGSQARRFAYDSLSRLVFAANPEHDVSSDPVFTFNSQQWAVKYEYDAASNLSKKTDTRRNSANQFVSITYGYDSLNRIKTGTYNDGTPLVTYNYDTATNGVGRLASVVTTGVSTYTYNAFDALGRPIAYKQTTGGIDYPMSSEYNKAGLMTSQTYPSNKKVVTSYDAAGRIAGVKDSLAAAYYVGASATDSSNRIQYTATGAVSVIKLGNGLWEHTNYNSRLQPTQIGLGTTSTNSGTMKLDYTYGTGAGSDNNGNVVTQTITVGASVMLQSYGYDRVNRLLTASESVGGVTKWTQTFGYDVYGNRTSLVNTGPDSGWLPPASAPAVNAANNRFNSPFGYDPAGNVTTDNNGNIFGYDAENRQKTCTVAGLPSKYSYDGDGHRVTKEVGADPSKVTTVFVYNASGQMIAEYNTPDQPVQGGGGTSYLTADHLGSTRVVTDSSGGVKARHDYLAFGEEISANVSGRTTGMGYSVVDGVRQKFTQKERDNESGLDYFGARYYSSSYARFCSPDKWGTSLSHLVDPQRLNRYAYVRDNPNKYDDPDGNDLKLKSGMKKSDQDRIIKDAVRLYRKQSGREAIESMKKSDISYVVGNGKLPSQMNLLTNTVKEKYGSTDRVNFKGTPDPNAPGKITDIDRKSGEVTITFDFQKRDDAQRAYENGQRATAPDSEQHVFNHEWGHGDDMNKDMVKEYNQSEEDAEKNAEAFARKVEGEKNTLNEAEAEKRVGEIFQVPPGPKKKAP